jgi:hypothetical protein
MALATLSVLKDYLGVDGSAEDAYLTLLLAGVDAAFKAQVGWQLERATYTEYHSGAGTPWLLLNEVPALSVSSVWLDDGGYDGQGEDAFAAGTLLAAGKDYYLELDGSGAAYSASGLLIRSNGVWPGMWSRRTGTLSSGYVRNQGNVKVVYDGGYDPVPADVVLAVLQACAYMRQGRKGGLLLQSERLGNYSYALAAGTDALHQVGGSERIIARYKRADIR